MIAILIIKCLANLIYMLNFVLIRYLGHLKSYVKNKAQPEGSIIEGYLAEECLAFYSRYLNGIETRFNWVGWFDDFFSQFESYQESSIFLNIGQSIGKVLTFTLTQLELA